MVKPCILAGVVLAACVVGSHCFSGLVLTRGSLRPVVSSSRPGSSWVSTRMVVTEEPATTVSSPSSPAEESEPSGSGSMVIVSKENTEFSAGVVGGITGFVIGGPVLAAILAIAANYGSKRENEAGVAVRAVGKSAIDVFNFLSSLNTKYDVTGKAADSIDGAVTKLKESNDSGETIEQVEKTLKDLSSKAGQLSTEYDIPAKARQALGVAGELADTAIEKGIELEKEYKVTEKVTDAVKKTMDGANS